MKPLSEFIKLSAGSERIERKFLMSQGQSYNAEWALISHGFKVANEPRQVSSYYFDDIDFTCLRDNVNGNPYRDKLRVRYYNENTFDAAIEIKHKRNVLGYKYTEALTGNTTTQQLLNSTKSWCNKNLVLSLQPASLVSYQRQYFSFGGLRATIDRSVKGYRVVGSGLIKSGFFDYEVVELKYLRESDSDIREIFDHLASFAMRPTKSSKYAHSLMY